MTTTSALSTPTLYSFGVLSVLPGQTITLKSLTNKTITSGSWSMSFRVRLRTVGTKSKLLQVGSTVSLYLGSSVSASTPHDNRIHAAFKSSSDDDNVTWVDSQANLTVDVWHDITLTVQKVSTSKVEVMIYTDAAPFGLPDDPSHTPPAQVVNTYATSSSGYPVLGGAVDAEFMNITFWNEVLGETNIIQNAYQSPATLPAASHVLKSFDFSVLENNPSLFTLNKGAKLLCVNNATVFGNGVALPDAQDLLNPGGDTSQPFSVQASLYSLPPISDADSLLSPVIVGNGLSTDPLAFALGVQYSADLQTYRLAVKFPGHEGLIVDTTSLPARTWNTVAITWDGSRLVFYVNGVAASSLTLASASPLARAQVCIGAMASAASVSGYGQFFLGQLQGVGIWHRALTATELAAYQTPSPSSREGLSGHFDLSSTELANQVTGRRLNLKGTILVQETSTPDFRAATSRSAQPPLNPQQEDYANLTVLEAVNASLPPTGGERMLDASAPLKSTRLSSQQVDRLANAVNFYVKLVPPAQQEQYRRLWKHQLRRALQRLDAAGDHVPGSYTSTLDGDECVTHFHTAQGLLEVNRSAAATVDPCLTWRVNVIATGIATFLSVIGVGFASKALYDVISKLFGKGFQFVPVFAQVADKTADVGAILTAVQYLLGSGQLTTTLLDCLAGVSWWNMAWTVGCIVFNIVSLFATGGAALAFLVANLLLNIASFIYVVSQKPRGC